MLLQHRSFPHNLVTGTKKVFFTPGPAESAMPLESFKPMEPGHDVKDPSVRLGIYERGITALLSLRAAHDDATAEKLEVKLRSAVQTEREHKPPQDEKFEARLTAIERQLRTGSDKAETRTPLEDQATKLAQQLNDIAAKKVETKPDQSKGVQTVDPLTHMVAVATGTVGIVEGEKKGTTPKPQIDKYVDNFIRSEADKAWAENPNQPPPAVQDKQGNWFEAVALPQQKPGDPLVYTYKVKGEIK